MGNHDNIIEGWEMITEDEAIDAAIDKYGKDPTTSVAHCTFAADDGRKGPEYRFWLDLFLKLVKDTPMIGVRPIAAVPAIQRLESSAIGSLPILKNAAG